MSGGWSVSGGGTGIEARFDDMLRAASVLDSAADSLRERGTTDAMLAGHGDLLEAALLCPVEVARVEAAVASATTLPGGALPLGLQLEALALVVQSGVDLYRDTDELLGELREEAEHALGFTGGVLVGTNPLLAAGLALLLARDPEGVQEYLYDHPWLLDAATRGAPGLVQGGAFGLSTWLGPLGAPTLAALTGGRWPTSDYEDSVAGLQALLGLGGLAQDSGSFRAVGRDYEGAFDLSEENFLSGLAGRQNDIVYKNEAVQVVAVRQGGEIVSYVVQIPGTDPASGLTHGVSPYDWTTDVQEMTGEGSKVRAAIVEAMAAADLQGKPVMVAGHSLGGMLAASLAADDAIRGRFNIQSVVTYGSPVARYDIPADVSVLSVEHHEDVVPLVEGRDNPDAAHWTTVRTGTPGGSPTVTDAHSSGAGGYADTLVALDDLDSLPGDVRAAMAAWRERNQAFFQGDGRENVTDEATLYELEHTP